MIIRRRVETIEGIATRKAAEAVRAAIAEGVDALGAEIDRRYPQLPEDTRYVQAATDLGAAAGRAIERADWPGVLDDYLAGRADAERLRRAILADLPFHRDARLLPILRDLEEIIRDGISSGEWGFGTEGEAERPKAVAT